MNRICMALAAFVLFSPLNTIAADSKFMKEFKNNYELLELDLLNNPCEVATITNFVYKKDAATFTFTNGKMFFLRYVNDRPTTAIYIGDGKAEVAIPSHVERQTLISITRDSTVDQAFTFCFIRMADDFDLLVREKFALEQTELDMRNFGITKKEQGEFFFKPTVMHISDNNFQLLRSVYERKADGYFWIDFNRYVYSFDPNRPEEVIVGYEREGGDISATDAAVFQRTESNVTADLDMSTIDYPLSLLDRKGKLHLGGAEGDVIEGADISLGIVVNADSVRFASLYLHSRLKLDSIFIGNKPLDYYRRGDFSFVGLIFPEYYHKGDSFALRLFYHGKDYANLFPFLTQPQATPHSIEFIAPNGFTYIVPGMSEITPKNDDSVHFTVQPDEPYHLLSFQSYASNFDTVSLVSDIGVTVNFLKSKSITKNKFECFIPHETYQSVVMSAFNFMTSKLGAPPATFNLSVFPEGGMSLPGLIELPQVQCFKEETGGLHATAGFQAARQWFGGLARPASDREYWLLDAVPDYLSLLYIQDAVGPEIFFGELGRRRNFMHTLQERNDDQPLATGRRLDVTARTAKGVWVLHMLRSLMYDIDKSSDLTFWKFVRELAVLTNNKSFTNADVVKLAEKHYGQSLDWFFSQWLFGRNLPEFSGGYTYETRDNQFYVTTDVNIKGVDQAFSMPVLMRVADGAGASVYSRHILKSGANNFELGPFSSQPKEVVFNELYSVLSKGEVKKQ
ncbi:MAG: hypothetical protein SGI97_01580 [candidate division Zixibacteria bacterium]|nr:hypothetical protein [candidate division Zixibacteria bacterium]